MGVKMKIKRKYLNRLIENLLNEITPDILDPGMDVASSKRQSEDMAEYDIAAYAQTLSEIIVGFTPAGVAIDVKDLTLALKELYETRGDSGKLNATFAAIGFLPGIGDALKGAFKGFKKLPANQVDNVIDDTVSQFRKQDSKLVKKGAGQFEAPPMTHTIRKYEKTAAEDIFKNFRNGGDSKNAFIYTGNNASYVIKPKEIFDKLGGDASILDVLKYTYRKNGNMHGFNSIPKMKKGDEIKIYDNISHQKQGIVQVLKLTSDITQ
jgi:hypothetical protein